MKQRYTRKIQWTLCISNSQGTGKFVRDIEKVWDKSFGFFWAKNCHSLRQKREKSAILKIDYYAMFWWYFLRFKFCKVLLCWNVFVNSGRKILSLKLKYVWKSSTLYESRAEKYDSVFLHIGTFRCFRVLFTFYMKL